MFRSLFLGAGAGWSFAVAPLWVSTIFFTGLILNLFILPALKARG